MATIANFPRVCFENCIVKDHLNVTGTAEFRKKVVYKSLVELCGGIETDTINEKTLNAGVTVDGVLLKDDIVCADKVTVNTIELKTPGPGICFLNPILVDLINEKTLNAGVTVDGVLIKDFKVCANEVQTSLISEKTLNAGVLIDGVLLKDNNVTADTVCCNTELVTDTVIAKSEASPVCFNSPIQVDLILSKSTWGGVCIDNKSAIKVLVAPTIVPPGFVPGPAPNNMVVFAGMAWGNPAMFGPPGIILIPKSGVYCIKFQWTWAPAPGNFRKLIVESPLGNIIALDCVANVNGAPTTQSICIVDYFAASTQIGFLASHDQGAPIPNMAFPTFGCLNVYYLHEGFPI